MITKELFEAAVMALPEEVSSIVVGITVYKWLLEQDDNPMEIDPGNSKRKIRIHAIALDQKCQLLPYILRSVEDVKFIKAVNEVIGEPNAEFFDALMESTKDMEPDYALADMWRRTMGIPSRYHNFQTWRQFYEACKAVGLEAVEPHKQDDGIWFAVDLLHLVSHVPPEKFADHRLVRFDSVCNKFKFKIPGPGGAAALPYMSKCSRLMTLAYKEAA